MKKSTPLQERGPQSDAIDQLYGVPLEQFVAVRRQLAGELRASGELPASRLVASVAKPTRTVWALNQVARRRPELLNDLFDARDRAATAQTQSDGDRVRSTIKIYRDRMGDVVRAARDVLAEVGVTLSAAQSRRIGESLQAATAGDDAARSQLIAGRLARDLDVTDVSPELEVGPPPGRRPTSTKRSDDEAHAKPPSAAQVAREQALERKRVERERATEKVRQRVASLEDKVREARALASDAKAAAARAEAAAERTGREAADAERQLERARAELRALDK